MPTTRILPLCATLAVLAGPAWSARTCYAPGDAIAHQGKEICLAAHVYGVVEEEDGTRYLNLCAPGQPDCHFTVVSPAADKSEIGSLQPLVGTDFKLRGTVRALGQESFVVLSARRQFHDGPEKFRPNPALLDGFSAASDREAFRDPALSAKKRQSQSLFTSNGQGAR